MCADAAAPAPDGHSPFEAAARHGSFTKAAEELGTTQAAVSYQIKILEERVEAALFLRLPRRVVLSEAGQRLAPQVREAMDLLRQAFAAPVRSPMACSRSARCRPSQPNGWYRVSAPSNWPIQASQSGSTPSPG